MTGSKVDRWGAGVVQEIDAAAMHVWFNWQHLELDAGLCRQRHRPSNPSATSISVKQNFDDLDMFMAGGVIFF